MGKLQFDVNNQVEQPTIVLCENNYKKIGNLNSVTDIVYKDNMNAANSLSFTVHKHRDNNELCSLWDKITDFRIVWIPEFNEYFQISVSINETDDIIKNVTATALCEAELSQINIYNLDINSDNDIKFNNYERTSFYNPDNTSLSLLHRILSKVPHYKIKHVDSTLKNEKRTISADGTSVYDLLTGDVTTEFDCLFEFDSTDRGVSVYDLLNYCPKCNKRFEDNICPDCGNSSQLIKGYGQDTTIFINRDNLAQEITLDSNENEVKNCFKIIAGDDVMSSAVKDVSPNGSEYIMYFSEADYKNMYGGLAKKLQNYDRTLKDNEKQYTQILTDLYNAYDNKAYLISTMMPDITHEVGTAAQQIAKLTSSTLSPVAVKDVESTSVYTVTNAVLGIAKCLINTTDFKLTIEDGSTFNNQIWRGRFTVASYIKDDDNNPKDTATSEYISITVNDDLQTYIEQKIKRSIQKEGSDNLSDLFKIEKDEDFKSTLKLYCLKRLESFLSAYDGCLQVLNEANCGMSSSPFYDKLYLPYYNRRNYVEDEYNERAKQIEAVTVNISNLEWEKQSIQKILNLRTSLGEEDYLAYLTYLREDKYENSNYISDGLTNEEIIEQAKQLREKALKELKKSAEMKYTISSTLNNLLALKEFEPIINYFETGNYIRMEVDNIIYKMRLLSYEVNFSEDNIQTINVEFSDVINAKNNALGLKEILDQAKSISSSYPAVVNQMNKNTANAAIAPSWVENGLNLTNLKIVSTADNQNMTVDEHGLWMRMYDDITASYDPCWAKLQNNGLYLTKDNGKTIEVGVGEFVYVDPVTKEEVREYGIIAKKIIGKQILGEDRFGIYNANNTMEFSDNGLFITTNGDDVKNSNAFTIQKQYTKATGSVYEKQFYIDENGNVTLAGGAKIKWENVNSPEITDIDGLNDYLTQLDGRIQTFSQDDDPSADWTTPSLKKEHIGDIWLDTKNSITRRWLGEKWETITDSELSELAKSKAQIFTITPKPPYYVGDLWVQGENGDILTCQQTRLEGGYIDADWKIASKYTDDSGLQNFISNDYADYIEETKDQLDKKTQTWYQANDPSIDWKDDSTKKEHVGDLWYNISSTSKQTFVYISSYTWKEMEVSKEVFDTIDGKASIYISKPNNYKSKDLWILDIENSNGSNSTYPKYKQGTILVSTKDNTGYNVSDWIEKVRYTDDTKADSAYELAESAKNLGCKLQKCLGFTTEITSDYVISPFIGGGYLQISSDNRGKVIIDPLGLVQQSHIFSIYNNNGDIVMGVDTSGNGTFSGDVITKNIIATGGNIGGFTISDYAIDSRTHNASNQITARVGMSTNWWAFYAGADYNWGTESSPVWNPIFCVGRDGTLYSQNAIIKGNITATSGNIGGFVISETGINSVDNRVGINTTAGWGVYAGDMVAGTDRHIFCVGLDGALYAENASIVGNITANSGRIGNWHIIDGNLRYVADENEQAYLTPTEFLLSRKEGANLHAYVGQIYMQNDSQSRSISIDCNEGVISLGGDWSTPWGDVEG